MQKILQLLQLWWTESRENFKEEIWGFLTESLPILCGVLLMFVVIFAIVGGLFYIVGTLNYLQ